MPTSPLERQVTETLLEARRARLRAVHAASEAETLLDRARARVTAAENTPAARRKKRRDRRRRTLAWGLRHPVQFTRLRMAHLVSAAGLRPMTDIVEAGFHSVEGLAAGAASGRDTSRPEMSHAVEDLGPVDIAGTARSSLLAGHETALTWRVTVPRGAVLRVDCGTPADERGHHPAGMTFEIAARSLETDWTGRASRTLLPGERRSDRYWCVLQLQLPADVGGDVEIALTSRAPAGRDAHDAWGVWGEPRVLRRRSFLAACRWLLAASPGGTSGNRPRRYDTDRVNAGYQRWLSAHAHSQEARMDEARALAEMAYRPTFSVITPVHDTAPAWLHACITSVRRQTYPHWQLCIVDDGSTSPETRQALDTYVDVDPRISILRLPVSEHISAASNAALDLASGEFVAFLDHDDELTPDALFEVAALLNAQPTLDFIYSDEDKLEEDGTFCDPYFKPDWSPELFLHFMYTNHLMVLRRATVDAVGRFRRGFEGSQDYDLALRVVSVTDRIGHVPKILYHWRKVSGSAAVDPVAKPWALSAATRALESHVERVRMEAEVLQGASPGLFRVRQRIVGAPLVSIVIPTDDRSREIDGTRVSLLSQCVRSIHERSTYRHYELVIVDNGVLSAATQEKIEGIPYRRASYLAEGPFNFAQKLNYSASHASGDYLLLLNDDTEVITGEWIEAMLEYAQDPAIGAVGARLLYPDGRLQHIGVAMGVCGLAAHLHHQAPGSDPGYYGAALGPRNYSAVTGAVMMTSRRVFEAHGGFDTRLPTDFNDIDYCLRLRESGLRVVYTPYAQLYHHESATQGSRGWDPADVAYMRERWADVLRADPYYNPNLTHDHPDPRRGL